MTHIQIAGLIKILRELQMHKMSWPFREPGKSDSETDVIKEPMGRCRIYCWEGHVIIFGFGTIEFGFLVKFDLKILALKLFLVKISLKDRLP